MTVIQKIRRKELIVASREANGWTAEQITSLIQKTYSMPGLLNTCVRSDRGKFSIDMAILYYRTGKLNYFIPRY